EDPGDDPINARNRLTGYVLIAAIAVSSIALSLLALGTESRSLWLVSILVRYAGIGVIAAIAIVLSWVVRKGVGFFEKALQFIVEPLAALAPGITLKNASARLFGGKGLDIVDEDFIGNKITAAASALLVLCIPFDIIVFLYPTTGTASAVGGAYLVSLITGYLAKKVGKGDVVQKSLERFAEILFVWGKWVALLVIIGWAAVVPEHTRAAIDIQSWVASLWISRFIAGDVGICGGYSVWKALGYLPIAGIIAYAVYHFTEEMKDGWKGRTKAGLRVITSLLVLHSLVVALVAFGIWGNPVKGVTLQSSVVQPKVDVEEIAIQSMDATADAPTVDARENVVKLSWTTNGPSDCRVEIARIAYKGKEVEHAYLKEGTMLQAVANVPRTAHHLFLNDLALGMTVVYRIHVTGLEDAQRGVTTVTREFNVSPAPPKLADAKKDEPKPEPSETPSATPSVPPAGPTVGRRNVK
ncbi:hypothetical protein KJ925_03205, partial [Patescibacteria group bacterium]|nr:hypothetical protein [Patescibacteria group bacterium]